jgi:atypical dual specificity phosphatase
MVSKIMSQLFLGPASFAHVKSSLKSAGITHIVICADELNPAFLGDFKYYKIGLYPSISKENISNIHEAVDFIENAISKENGKVYVHCMYGVTRSPAIVMAYLIKYRMMSAFEAMKAVKEDRPQIRMHSEFTPLLEVYEKILGGKSFDELVSSGLIEFN